MLSESELKLQVENYLSTRKTDYAILIDGEWGVGKTYFVKNLIEETLNNEEFSSKDNYKGWIYISLYGLRDTTDIDKMISINILKRFKMFQKLSGKSKTINAFGNAASSSVKSGIGHNSSNKIFKNLSKISKIRIDDIVLIAQEFQVLKDYVLVIDDLERSDIPINELLGYINNLTETKETKVIAIANEKEIDVSRLSKNRELKYIFSTLFTEFNRSDNDKENVEIINLEKIDSVANDFFRVNKEYSIIKEKTFGFTFKFRPKIDPILDIFIKEYVTNNRLLFEEYSLLELVNRHKIHNLRTVKTSLVMYKMIEERLDNSDKINIKILEAILYFTHESNKSIISTLTTEDSIDKTIERLLDSGIEHRYYFEFINEFVKHGTTTNFDDGLIKLKDYLDTIKRNKIYNDIITILINFTVTEDELVLNTIENFKSLINSDDFNPLFSGVVIEIVRTLNYFDYNVEENFIEIAKNKAFDAKISSRDIIRYAKVSYDEELRENIDKEIDEFLNLLEKNRTNFRSEYDENWIEKFSEFCEENKGEVFSKGILSFIDLNKLQVWFGVATSEQIDIFRMLLLGYKLVVNADERIKEKYLEDLEKLQKVVDSLDIESKTKEIQLDFLKSNIELLLKQDFKI